MKKPTFSRITTIIVTIFIGINAYTQNYVPFTPRFNQDLKGDIILIGNNILGPDNNAFNDNSVYNHNVDMQYIDIDGDASTFSSSSADLNIPNPNCYEIIYAGLYWGAVTAGDEPITNVRFSGPTGGYNDITGTIIFDAGNTSVDGGDSFSYACFADVTDIVTNLGTDLGTYTVANVSAARGETSTFDPYNGTGQSAGWSLFVVYEDPTLPGKSITSFDGFSAISVPGGNPNLDIPVSGFRTVPAPAPVRANFAFATLEGDSPILGDRLLLNGVPLSTVDRPVGNFFNSSVTQLNATPVNDRVPNSTNTLGFDTGVMAVPNPGNTVIANDATAATVRLETSGDTYFNYFFAFAVEIIEPNIVLTKIVEDDSGNNIGGTGVGLSTPLNYVIGFQNTGNDNATNLQIRDVLPINIIYNHPTDLVLPAGVTVSSYNPATRELIFDVEDYLVEENDPVNEIRIEVQTVDTCNQLADACSNIINNQAFATYNGFFNPTFQITDDPSINSNTGCLLTPQATNFLINLDCTFEYDQVLCGSTLDLTAANGYSSYSWSTSPSGTPVIGSTQTITVSNTGTYYAFNTADAPCQSIVQQFNVELFGNTTTNPVIPFADEVVICPNDGKELPNIYLCGADDFVDIDTDISGASSIIWEQLDESSCPPVADNDCANEDSACTWNQVATGPDFVADTAGQYRLTINYDGGCFVQFYFNVYENLLAPSVVSEDIICTTPGSIIVNDVPSGYEYSIDGVNYQASNAFTVNTPGIYTVYIRQVGITTNPCIFTVPDVLIRERDFTVSTVVTQPLCNGDLGSIQISANDVEPQYTFEIYEGGTLVNSVGPIIENTYSFENLNTGTYTLNITTEDGCTYSEDVTIVEPPLLTVTAALTTPLTCTDGEITIYPEGGTAPYFYFINSTTDFQTVPEYTVTSAGSYDITVVDANNCSATTTINVDAASPPDFTVNTTDILCPGDNNGTITINVSNANGNSIQYSIDNGLTFFNSNVFSGLSAGNYMVVLEYTFGGAICTTSPQNVTINENPPITGTAELSAPYTCTSNGTITVTGVSGGTAPYMYSIDGINFQSGNSFTGLTQGTYTVTISDGNSCTLTTNQITILPLNPPTDMDFSHSPIDCAANTTDITITNVIGGTGTLEYQIIAPSGSATPYQSSPTFNGLQPGTYTFQVQDENDCIYSESYTVDPLPVSTVNIVLTEGLDCTGSPDAVITGTINGTAPYTYAVSINGSTFSSLGTTGNTFTYSTSTAGDYQFEITDGNGCTALSSVLTINPLVPPSISALVQSQNINCNGEATGALDITIDNTLGTPPFVINVNNDTTSTDYGNQTTSLPAGDYTVTITDANSCTDTQTVTISQPDAIVVNSSTVDITCTASGISQGSVIINNVTGGTAPYNYFVTGTNGYSNSELNATGSTSVSFDVVDFGLYQINVVDANGCSVLIQDVLVASPPSDLDITITPTVNCSTGGEATIAVSSALSSSGPFFFSIYQEPFVPYTVGDPNWLAENPAGSASTIFTGLIPGVQYTFVVYDSATNCTYYETATASIPTNSTLTLSAFGSNNITCTGNADGNVSFTIESIYSTSVDVSYQVYESQSLTPIGTIATGTVPANGNLVVTDFESLPFGNYFVSIVETSGPNAGCGIVTAPFNITESEFPLDLSVFVNQNANCNPNSGVISAVAENGTAPYQYQITTTPTAPLATDTGWNSASTFNLDANTYYVHVLDAYGCIVTSPATILPMDDSPVITAVVNDDCLDVDGTFQIDVDLALAGIAPYSISIDGGAFQTQNFPFTISNLASGTHTVEINDANGCGNLISVDILPVLDLSPTVNTLPTCNNDDGEITLTTIGGSGNYTYTILPSPPSIVITGNTISGVPSGLYDITVTDTNTGCTEDVSVSLPEAIAPTVTLSPNSVTCFGDNSGAFDLEVTNYSGAYTYEVIDASNTSVFGVVAANTSTNPITVNGLTSGTYTVNIIQTDVPFCSSTAEVIVGSPQEELLLDVTETSNVTCNNNQGTITAIATGGWGDYQYELTGDATVAFSPNGTFTDLSAGNYTVNVRDAQGCVVSENITLEEPTLINATFTPSTTMLDCFGDANASITISTVSGGQGENYTYTLNMISPVVTTSGPQTSNVFNDLSAGTYSVTITDGFDCTMTSIEMTIDEPSPINANLVLATNQTCLTEATLTLSASGGTAPYSYSMDSSFSTILGTFNASTTFDVPVGTHNYYVRDANNCLANVSNDITIDPLPDLMVGLQSQNPTINCAGDNTGTITATATGGLGNYIYTLQDTSGNTINATQNSPGYFTELLAGNYVVFVESGDCTALSTSISITEPSTILQATPSVINVQCAGTENGQITINASGGTGIIKYAISPQLNQFFDTNVFDNLAPGTYDIIVQDELGCYLTFTETVTEPVQVLLGLVPNSILPEVCDGDADGEFSIDISGGTTPYSVSLDNYDGPYTMGAVGQTQFDFTNLSGGDHIVYVRDAEGCESEWNITFPNSARINPVVEVEYNCEQNAQFNTVTVTVDESITDMSELDFSLNGGPYQASNIFTDIPPTSDNYIDVRHSNGCIQRTELFDMSTYEPVTLVLTGGEELNQIVAEAGGGTGEYTFTFNEEDYGAENTYTIGQSGIYTVTVTDTNGCTAIAQVEREFIEICIPNYFTPNGDGVVDTWSPGCIENYPNLEFDIFDRYGRKVATYRAGEYWDGRYNGTELPTGDYWYVVRPNDDTVSESFVGHFTLYR
ncbi:T9SS type B sorting domain-containing protein [Winogradskyella jejuensis]|uniref:Gliding motility-associated C-terminal domain-containing protein n=1 Tax=Winogradskyella jejuensis TaxID=1089305 RepID=A0A1M5UDI7_9FLAO|nr:T9SS type B sorting domain-containing protein [Winogradskyella jejuensis]SHH61017.1 gliding motility-associated C-terminal domain-containing protein [Winogradskyella jejuensis]